jgi:hypothetical protein
MSIQAILFDRDYWDTKRAREYLKEFKFNPIKRVHITDKYLRYRLLQPDYDNNNYFIKRGYNHIDYIIEVKK